MADSIPPSVPSSIGGTQRDTDRGEGRPPHASDGQLPPEGIGPRPESSSTFDVSWEVTSDGSGGNGRIGGNPAAMALHRRIFGMNRTSRDENSTQDDRNP